MRINGKKYPKLAKQFEAQMQVITGNSLKQDSSFRGRYHWENRNIHGTVDYQDDGVSVSYSLATYTPEGEYNGHLRLLTINY